MIEGFSQVGYDQFGGEAKRSWVRLKKNTVVNVDQQLVKRCLEVRLLT